MPPQPKRKLSKGRRDRRRAHDALEVPNLVACTNCGTMILSHIVCPNCGFYKGREIIEVKSKKKTGCEFHSPKIFGKEENSRKQKD
jgi:large subunit ribosomal protein L32